MLSDLQLQLLSLLENHHAKRPLMQLQDAYKLLYQAYMGIGHLIADREAALRYLVKECSSVQEQRVTEDLWEPISPTGNVGRVNLRPYILTQTDPAVFVDALMQFAQYPPGTKAQLQTAWFTMGDLIEAGQLSLWSLDEYNELTQDLTEHDYPVMHHSRIYHNTYQPAYRILSEAIFKRLFRAPTCR